MTGSYPPLDALLARLGPDRESAAALYEQLRRKVIKYFIWERCTEPEELADEVLDRVARKAAQGEDIQNWSAYAGGVARLVLKEYRAHQQRRELSLGEYARSAAKGDDAREDLEGAAARLEECLAQLAEHQRRLVVRYYEGDHAGRIRNRRELGEELGLNANALRNRVLRLRNLLEACLEQRDALRNPATKSREAKL